MNPVIPLIFFLAFAQYLSAQKERTISYFNAKGKLVDSVESIYFRCSTDTAGYYRSFWTNSSAIMFEGEIINARDSSDEKNRYRGKCIWFYSNGNKRLEAEYTIDGRKTGSYKEYHLNGNLKKQLVYNNDRIKNKRLNEYTVAGDSIKVYMEEYFPEDAEIIKTIAINGSCKPKLGGVEITNNGNKSCMSIHGYRPSFPLYSVEININSNYLQYGSPAGLIFNYENDSNYRYFCVDKGNLFIGTVKKGSEIKMISGLPVTGLHLNSWNNLKVYVSGKTLIYYVNDVAQIAVEGDSCLQGNAGLIMKSKGLCLFDNLVFKEYYKPLNKDDNISEPRLFLPETNPGLLSIGTGIVLSQSGLIATAMPISESSFKKIIIKAFVNDSVKEFEGSVIMKKNNLCLLKINNLNNDSLSSIQYTYFDKPNLALKSRLIGFTYYTHLHKFPFVPVPIEGTLITQARYENFLSCFEWDAQLDDIYTGSPVFTENGELIGILTHPANPNSKKNSVIAKIHELQNLLFYSRQKTDVVKKTATSLIPTIEALSKNLVLVQFCN